MKTIVIHTFPDIDAITSAWLIHRFLPGWKNAKIEFVQIGTTLNDEPVDKHPDIIHADTGYGKFDHHQTDANTCAAKLIYEHLLEKKYLRGADIEALEKLVDVVNRYDHFMDVNLDNPDDDMYDFSLAYIIHGLRIKLQDHHKVVETCEPLLDALHINYKNKVHAEKDIEEGFIFNSTWGKSIALESENDETMKLSSKKGFDLVIRKSKQYGHVRIKISPTNKLNLEKLYKVIIKKDPKATWFYHKSGKMLLNGSSKRPGSVASNLSLNQVVEIVRAIK